MSYYHCVKCGKTYTSSTAKKEKIKVKSFFGVLKIKKIPYCCDRPLRKITKDVFKQIKSYS